MYSYIASLSELSSFQKSLINRKDTVIGFDIETSGLDPYLNFIRLIQVEIDNKIFLFDAQLLGDKNIIYICSLLQESDSILVGFNLKFDLKFIKSKYNLLFTDLIDLQSAEVMVTNGLALSRYPSLDDICLKYLGIQLDKTVRKKFYEDPFGQITEDMLVYSTEDVMYLKRLKDILLVKLIEQKQLDVFNLENRLTPVTVMMELEGILLDKVAWENLAKLAEVERDLFHKKIKDYILNNIDTTKFNSSIELSETLGIKVKLVRDKKYLEQVDSTYALTSWIYERLNPGSHVHMKNALNLFNIPVEDTNEDTLVLFAGEPLIDLILEYRNRAKRVSTYGVSWFENIHPTTGRIHSKFNQLGATSGRYSCVPLDSEILTLNGWKKYNEVNIGDQVIGFDLQKYQYKITTIDDITIGKDLVGRLVVNKGHDSKYQKGILCTANHKWITKDSKIIGFSNANSIPRKYDTVLMPNVKLQDCKTSLLDKTQALLLGWYLSDGFLTGKKNHGLGISLVKGRSIQLLKGWLDENNVSYTLNRYKQYEYDSHYVSAFHISSEIFEPIYQTFLTHPPSKIIMSLSEECWEIMYLSMIEGDGSYRRELKKYIGFGSLETQKKQSCEYFELLSLALAKPYSFSKRKLKSGKPFIYYHLTCSDELYANRNCNWAPEKEMDVWCPTTECGTWVMKQGHIVAITGNSDSINLQNIPKLAEYRATFIARPGYKLLRADYNQEEYRLVGEITEDELIIKAYQEGKDMHTSTAALVNHCTLDEVIKEQRDDAKNINFASLFGSSAWGLSKKLHISQDVAEDVLIAINTGYPTMVAFRKSFGEAVLSKGHTKTLLGRKRYFDHRRIYKNMEEAEKENAASMREGYNMLIQGSAADIIKDAMCNLFYNNPFEYKDFHILMQVHDEVVIEVKDEIVNAAIKFVEETMLTAERIYLKVIPAAVEITVNDYWSK